MSFSTPPLEDLRQNIAKVFGTEKQEWCGYLIVKKFEECLAVLTQYQRVTDRRTDGQTDRAMHSITRQKKRNLAGYR